MKKNFFSALLFFMMLSILANNIHIRDFPLVRKAKLKGEPGKITAIPFDNKLYQNTNNDYSNIRIVDKNGKNVPFTVRKVFPIISKEIFAVLPAAGSDYRQDKRKKTAELKLALNMPLVISRISFPAEKILEGAGVTLKFFGKNNQELGEEQIFRLMPSEKTQKEINIDFPSVKAEKILVTVKFPDRISMDTAEAALKKMEIKQKIILELPGVPDVETVNLPEISRVNKGSLTEITVEADRIPCKSLKLTCDDPDFQRYVEIFSKTGEHEKCLVSRMISNDKNLISLPGIRGDYYIIRIHNGNQPALKNIHLQWEVKKQVLMFIPPEKGDLKIFYGGNSRVRQYDIEYAERHGLPPQIYELEEETVSPDYEPQIPAIDLYKYLMWVVIVIAAMFFFLMVVRMLNRNK